MADHYSRTFTIPAGPASTTVTLDGMPFGAGRLSVSRLGAPADLWLSVGRDPASVGGEDVVFLPAAKVEEVVDISGLLQREQHAATYPDWSFTVVCVAGCQLNVELLDACGLDIT
jgi:hypothetical protein